MLPLVTAQTVAFDRGFGGRISRGGTHAGKLKPLDVERETRSGKYPDGDGLYLVVANPTSKSWSYPYWKDGKQRWLGLGSLKDVSLRDARLARDAARLRVKGDRSTPGVDISPLDYESRGQEFESLRARHFGTELGTPKPAVFALDAATSVRRSTLFDPMMRSSF
jgi:Arm DNA-binding domain